VRRSPPYLNSLALIPLGPVANPNYIYMKSIIKSELVNISLMKFLFILPVTVTDYFMVPC
jgi:hypothetical protein